jgi:CheY-like chemotaxis protein
MDEAVTKLEGARIDAIVTDNNLGPRSGCEFIRHVRRKGLTCPVIMVTCSNNPEVAEAAYSAGVTKIFGAYDEVFTEFLKRQLEQSVSKADRGKISSGQP